MNFKTNLSFLVGGLSTIVLYVLQSQEVELNKGLLALIPTLVGVFVVVVAWIFAKFHIQSPEHTRIILSLKYRIKGIEEEIDSLERRGINADDAQKRLSEAYLAKDNFLNIASSKNSNGN